jgi:hypothetical protein
MAAPDTVVVVTVAEPVPAREDASGSTAAALDEAPGVERCRICFEGPEEALPLLSLSCLCKGGLSQVHAPCAEAWFKRKGARVRQWRWGLCKRRWRASYQPVVSGVALHADPRLHLPPPPRRQRHV